MKGRIELGERLTEAKERPKTGNRQRDWMYEILDEIDGGFIGSMTLMAEGQDRTVGTIENPVTRALEEIDTLFIAPHDATNRELAACGYTLLAILLLNTAAAGQAHKILHHKELLRESGGKGGKGNSVSRRKKQDEDWGAVARDIATRFVARHPNWKIGELVRHLRRHADLKEKKVPTTDRAIRNAIKGWGLVPKKAGSEARLTV